MKALAATARFVLGVLYIALLATAQVQDPRASIAQKTALEFLALTDRNDAKASWQAAGKQFQHAITPERWTDELNKVRPPLGALVDRTLISTQFTSNFPGAAGEGEYVLLQFRSHFAKGGEGRETVTLQRESDGAWRVIGYFIR